MNKGQKLRKDFRVIILLVIFSNEIKISLQDLNYNVGVAIADITGPVGLGLMGYAHASQTAHGIHTRLFSRAFIFQSDANPASLVVLVTADIGMVDHGIKLGVIRKLQKIHGFALFKPENILISGTHTHSGPGGFLQHFLYGLSTRGFLRSSFESIVDGIVESISNAYYHLQPGKIFINRGNVQGASRNRSPSSYEANPDNEKQEYLDKGGNVDTEMTLVRVEAVDGTALGCINWFAVHATSMNNSNRLISGDNKGYASMLFEYKMNPDSRPGSGEFVAAFANSNSGDVSPNINGAKCIDTGESCEWTGVCRNRSQTCIAFGPGRNMEESTEIIGRIQFDEAYQLFKDEAGTSKELRGEIKYIHQYVNMSSYSVNITDGETNETLVKTTCPPALGYSFAAGTSDGAGAFDFIQGDTTGSNSFWRLIRNFIRKPSKNLTLCHEPKPILLPLGEMSMPYDWVTQIVETQLIQIGSLFIVGFPGEITTMSGRRLKKSVENAIRETWNESGDPLVVIAGLSNVYSHYVTTFEEYQMQRYEAASTLFGQFTLDAYLQQFRHLAKNLNKGELFTKGPPPPNNFEKHLTLLLPVIWDTPPFFRKFGDVLLQPPSFVKKGETVMTKFVGGHPRNNVMRGNSFLLVERKLNESSFEIVATDADWNTKFKWYRPRSMSTESVVEITWKVPKVIDDGVYRISHFGYYKKLWSRHPTKYEGMTSEFKIS